MRDQKQGGSTPDSATNRTSAARKFEAAQQIARTGYWEYHFDGTVTWSQEAFRICGKDPRTFEPDKESIKEGVYYEDQQEFERIHSLVSTEGGNYELEYRKVLPSGEMKWIRERCRLIKDEDGRHLRVEGMIQAIMDRKQEQKDYQ